MMRVDANFGKQEAANVALGYCTVDVCQYNLTVLRKTETLFKVQTASPQGLTCRM